MSKLLKNPAFLKKHIIDVLEERNRKESFLPGKNEKSGVDSSVLLPLGICTQNDGLPEPCLILNKRSNRVRQPGDLCCPGGSLSPRLDRFLARLMPLPAFPLSRWPHWKKWRMERPLEASWISIMLATSLRESFEEMKLNPMGVKFLGPLPSHCLRMFQRAIHPMVGWIVYQKNFVPNWEVEKIVRIPIRSLMNNAAYARFRLSYPPHIQKALNRDTEDFPCFIFKTRNGEEMLWGVTFRIVAAFMKQVFNFVPPDMSSLPIISGILEEQYLTGS